MFTPASYAFAIWGLIFTGLLIFCIFQVSRAFAKNKEDDFINQTGPWYSIANVANAAWLWFWLNEVTWLTVLIMLVMLFSLLQVITRLDMTRRKVTTAVKSFVWFPIALYAGWITVATIANIAAYLAKINFDFLFSETTWTILLIIAAVLINGLVLITRRIHVFAMVGVWALAAISIRHWDSMPSLQWAALLGAIGLFIGVLLSIFSKK